MSLYAYKVFNEVVNSGSFVEASEKLNLSASAVSHMIKSLEDEFGFPLFTRNRAGASLTDNGKRIAPFIRAVTSAEENLEQQVNKINNHDIGTVKVALFSSVASNWFVRILSSFREKYPGINVVIYQGSYNEVVNWVKEKAVDIAFTTDMLTEDMDFMPLRQDPLICVTPGNYIPRNKFSVSVEDLKDANVIINNECEAYDAKGFLENNGIVVGTYYDVVEHQTLFAMVREGMGICIVPELVASATPPNVKKYPIVGNPSRTIGLTLPDPSFVSPVTELLKLEIINFTKNL